MKAIGYQTPGSATVLRDIEMPSPIATGHDILVRITAVSVNPVDTKIRIGVRPDAGTSKVLGWDGIGTVEAIGPAVTRFKPGERVFYAGALTRPGTNAEYHLVDERLVGLAPSTLTDPEAAALPLTALTAWEMLFERLDICRPVPGAAPMVVIIGGAGGVGSMAIQLARARSDLIVVATASRPETRDWVRELGAHYVVDHRRPLAPQIEALGLGQPGFVFSTTHTNQHLTNINALIAPQGRFGVIDDPDTLDIVPFKRKSVSVHWELMFTRSLYETEDMAQQGHILGQIAHMVDAFQLRSTVTKVLHPINAANLIAAHEEIESGRSRGKIVLAGF